MGRYASSNGNSDFTPAPAGTHLARCIRITDLGTQRGEYLGLPTVRNQVMVTWELPNETITIDGQAKPMLVSKFYTNTLNEKSNLYRDLVAWRGRQFSAEELKNFDLEAIIDKPCMVSVMQEERAGKVRAKVSSVSALPKGMQCPKAANPISVFWIDTWDEQAFAALSDGIKAIIAQSDEFKARQQPRNAMKDDLPWQDQQDQAVPF